MKTSPIGLNPKQSKALAKHLNDLLANYQIFYMNVRGFHWNVTGNEFFTLHEKFEQEYDLLLEKIDAIAERILTLGGQPMHAFSDYIKASDIKEKTNTADGHQCVKHLLDGYKTLISRQRNILEHASQAQDEGTLALMSEYISEQEKIVWMFQAYLAR